MTNARLQIKIKERLNKLSSSDYDNIECWQIAEAFNKAQIEWVRRQLHGNNIFKEGDEQSTRRVDDLQVILKTSILEGYTFDTYFESKTIPADFLEFKRVSTKGKTKTCPSRTFRVYLAQEADADELLIDSSNQPSFLWGETFCTLLGNKIRIYTNGEFTLDKPKLIYYRQPLQVQFKNCTDIDSEKLFTVDQICEFKDDIIELMIDEAVSILAGDMENMLQFQKNSQNAERNN